MSTLPINEYAILWFEDNSIFTLVNEDNYTVRLTFTEAQDESARILETEEDIDEADEGVRYAVPLYLLDELFGWTD